jgi:hypothetical protein
MLFVGRFPLIPLCICVPLLAVSLVVSILVYLHMNKRAHMFYECFPCSNCTHGFSKDALSSFEGTKYLRIDILITYFLENQNRDSKVAYDVTISVL